jgi:hypothetical protein
MMAEKTGIQWRPIPDFPAYRVTEEGRLLTCWGRGGSRRRLTDQWREVVGDTCHAGHRKVTLYAGDGRRRRVMLAALVLEAFIGPAPPGKPWSLHGDGNPANNRLDNLRWGTPADNGGDMVRHGNSRRGERSPQARLTTEEVRRIKQRHSAGESQSALAREHELSVTAIHYIVHGRNWRHVHV